MRFTGPASVFLLVWVVWGLSWLIAAIWAGPTRRRLPAGWEAVYRVPVAIGFLLLLPVISRRLGAAPLWHVGLGGAYALSLVTIAGLLFTWWARLHLGRLWSSAVTVKEGHRVVDTGPYALVRHPIYTGLIVAAFGSAVAEASVPALIGLALCIFGFWLKAQFEERFLAAELGADRYGAYRRRVPMLIPFGPTQQAR